MVDTSVGVSVDRHQVTVGQPVRALIGWQHDGEPEGVRIELRWYTEGRGDVNAAVVAVHRQTPELGPIPPQIEAVLLVPPGGPASYDGQMIRVRWEVRGIIELKWKRDPSFAVPLVVGPATVAQ
ncbi:MAG TPA: hypothetical protein VMM13_00500 [Euzebya sp.]|nr:hypothetical protein [Euzebya sp.]